MKKLSFAVALAVLGGAAADAAHAASIEHGDAVARPSNADAGFAGTAARSGDEEIRPHSAHLRPSASPEQRAAEAAKFETMAKDLVGLPYYTRNYVAPLVNEKFGAPPPVPTQFSFQHIVVGTDPSSSLVQGQYGVTTYVPVRLIPVVVTAPDGKVYDPSVELVPGQSNTAMTLDQVSPVFTYQAMTLGGVNFPSTQLLDAWVRGERWQYTQSLPNYHLYLSPTVGPALRVSPTAAQFKDLGATLMGDGTTTYNAYWGRMFSLDVTWLQQQAQSYVQAQGLTPATIPVFVTAYNIMSLDGQAAGLHFNSGTQTYIWHTYEVRQNTPAGQPVQGIPLEHELAELIDHPFPLSTLDQSACAPTGYESGDPLESGEADFTLANSAGLSYSFQDLTYAGWNEGEFPSKALNGHYTLQNAFRFPCF